jgi:hypothetical protein
MVPKVLKDDVFEKIENENVLLGNLANVLNISITSIPNMLTRKSRRFTEFPAIKLIADFLHCEMDDLLIDDAKVVEK